MHSFMTTKEQNKLQVSDYTPQQISFEVFIGNYSLPLPLFGPQRWDFSWFHPWKDLWVSQWFLWKFHGIFSLHFFPKTCFHHFIFHTFSIIFPFHIFPAFFWNVLLNFHTFSHWNMLQIWVFFVAPTASSVSGAEALWHRLEETVARCEGFESHLIWVWSKTNLSKARISRLWTW